MVLRWLGSAALQYQGCTGGGILFAVQVQIVAVVLAVVVVVVVVVVLLLIPAALRTEIRREHRVIPL